ncbi:MAG: aminoacetone oxidase family FAD-binding enzyme [Lachnospiraceae bacterium]|nr:aminoacetone oxidase family FAD-binding enzyme [Lachnospiraceae bacterium]
MSRKVAVIGGGAAGMMSAVQAALLGAQVELYEKNNRVGKKLLATGNGKCNFSNMNMEQSVYYGSMAAYYDEMFSKFGVRDTIDFFSQCGMLIKDKNGYLYPRSEQAATVLDVLRFELEKCKVTVYTDMSVKGIQIGQSGSKNNEKNCENSNESKKIGVITVSAASGGNAVKFYDAVILACGGMAAPKTGSDGSGLKIAQDLGHQLIKAVPALVQLRCSDPFFKSVAGVRTDAGVTLYIDGQKEAYERGELQLTDYGISGIPVFQFSRKAAYGLLHKRKVEAYINFLPDYTDDEYGKLWEMRWKSQSSGYLEQFLTGIANKKINQLIIKLAGCGPHDKVSDIPAKKRKKIEDLYRSLKVTVCKTNGFEYSQVSAGGILAEELTLDLESKIVPNLYFAGEIIDMDGICGGYNLQWAWTSGAVAGRAAATKH